MTLNKDALNLDLTKINYDSFGYDQGDHFLDFLNKRPSKWELIFRQMYPEDSNRRTLLYSQVIDPKNINTLGLKPKFIKKLKHRSRKRSKYSIPSRRGKSSKLIKFAGSTNEINNLDGSNKSHKNISLGSIRSKSSVKDIRLKISHGSSINITSPILK